jgi:hypothetical protein
MLDGKSQPQNVRERTRGFHVSAKFYKLGRPRKRRKEFWEKKDERFQTVGTTVIYWPYDDQKRGRKFIAEEIAREGDGTSNAEQLGLEDPGSADNSRQAGGGSRPPRTVASSLTPAGRTLWRGLRRLPVGAAVNDFLRLKVQGNEVAEADLASVLKAFKQERDWARRAKVKWVPTGKLWLLLWPW